MDRSTNELRADATAIYAAAIAAVDPVAAVRRALAPSRPNARLWLIAVGKAADPMARAAIEKFQDEATNLLGGLVVAPHSGLPIAGVAQVEGDHPEPLHQSQRASAALDDLASAVKPTDDVLVLLSGGATSLIGAPGHGLGLADYQALCRAAWRAGLPIGPLNQIRKRFSRWGGGRLAARLGARRVDVLAISDVPNDDPAAIGSGPCAPDPTEPSEIRRWLDDLGLDSAVGDRLRRWLDDPASMGPSSSTDCFRRVFTQVIASNTIAVAAAATAATTLGYQTTCLPETIEGDAATAGRWFADRLGTLTGRAALIGGGETTAVLDPESGLGGRCQSLALAAADRLRRRLTETILLVGSTDGRDGPTDAAGAIVDRLTWGAIERAGIDPAASLARHNAYPALANAGALLPASPTGTNVMDVVIGLTRD